MEKYEKLNLIMYNHVLNDKHSEKIKITFKSFLDKF